MLNIKKWILFPIGLLIQLGLLAQSTTATGSANGDAMRSNGKIYVVMVIVITILAGLILYLVRLDRKISRFEKEADI